MQARNVLERHPQWSAGFISLLADVEGGYVTQLVKAPPGGLLQPVDLHSAMNALKRVSAVGGKALPKAILFLMGPTASRQNGAGDRTA